MTYNFDKVIERRGTGCTKWDNLKALYGRDDLVSLWIADMDFEAPPCVQQAIQERAAHGIYGYPALLKGHYDGFIAWEKRHNNWEIQEDWIVYSPGVVAGVAAALLGFTSPGDGVVIMPPVYHPFRITLEAQGRKVVNNPMKLVNGRFEIDFDDLAVKAKDARMLILCNPHNPTGRCFTREELRRIEAICRENHLLVVADEIHSDIVYKGHQHIPFASLSGWAQEHSIVLRAPSKTFNIAGLVASVLLVPNPKLRAQMRRIFEGWLHVSGGNIFGHVGVKAAYEGGEEWFQALMAYLEENVAFLEQELAARIPQVKLIHPEAIYVPFMDFRGLGMEPAELQKFLVEKAKVAMNDGTMFGQEGAGFARINIATPRANLAAFLDNLEAAVKAL